MGSNFNGSASTSNSPSLLISVAGKLIFVYIYIICSASKVIIVDAMDMIHPEVGTVAHFLPQGRVVVILLDLDSKEMIPLGLLSLD